MSKTYVYILWNISASIAFLWCASSLLILLIGMYFSLKHKKSANDADGAAATTKGMSRDVPSLVTLFVLEWKFMTGASDLCCRTGFQRDVLFWWIQQIPWYENLSKDPHRDAILQVVKSTNSQTSIQTRSDAGTVPIYDAANQIPDVVPIQSTLGCSKNIPSTRSSNPTVDWICHTSNRPWCLLEDCINTLA